MALTQNNFTLKNTSQTIQPYIGIVLGAVYKISPSFLLYGEITPNVYYAYTAMTTNRTNTTSRSYTDNRTSSNNNIGLSNLSNSGAMLTLVYRITK